MPSNIVLNVTNEHLYLYLYLLSWALQTAAGKRIEANMRVDGFILYNSFHG